MNMHLKPAASAGGGAVYSQCKVGTRATADAPWVSFPQPVKEGEAEARCEKGVRKEKMV